MLRSRTYFEQVDTVAGPASAVWIDQLKLGDVWQDDERHPLTAEIFAAMLANFERLSSEGYRFHVSRQHLDDGYAYGEIHGMRTDGPFLQLLISLADREDRDAYNTGKIRHWSPGIDWHFMHPHTGEDIGPVIFHAAYVSEPQQKNLRYAQLENPGVTLAANRGNMTAPLNGAMFSHPRAKNGMASEVETLQAQIADLQQTITLGRSGQATAHIGAQISKLMDSLAPLMEVQEQLEGLLAQVSSLVAKADAAPAAGLPVEEELAADDEMPADETPVLEEEEEEEEEELSVLASDSDADALRAELQAARQELASLRESQVTEALDAAGVTGAEREVLATLGASDFDGLRVLLGARVVDGPTRQQPRGTDGGDGTGAEVSAADRIWAETVTKCGADDRNAIRMYLCKVHPNITGDLLRWSNIGKEIKRIEQKQPTKAAQLETERAALAVAIEAKA